MGLGVADPQLTKLATGTWNVTSLVGKEPELVHDIERYHLDIVRLTSMHIGSGTNLHERGWTLFYSGIAQGKRQWVGVGLLIAPQCKACALRFSLVDERIYTPAPLRQEMSSDCHLRLGAE